jgi:hypothetical protein
MALVETIESNKTQPVEGNSNNVKLQKCFRVDDEKCKDCDKHGNLKEGKVYSCYRRDDISMWRSDCLGNFEVY